MGKGTDEAIRQRRQRRTQQLVRVAAVNAAAGPQAEQADRRRRVAVAEVRRAIRIQRLAQAAIASADERGAAAVRILAHQGLAQRDIAAVCGVPQWTVRRVLALTKTTTDAAGTAPVGGATFD